MKRLKLMAAMAAALVLTGAATDRAFAGPTYGGVDDAADLGRVFAAIRADVDRAQSRGELRRLDHRAGYLVTLTYSRPWRVKFGDQLPRLRAEAVRQFRVTVQAINRRASAIGTEGDFQEDWGER